MAIIKKAIPGLKPGSDYLFTLKPKNVEISAVDTEQDTIRVSIPAFDGVPSVITGLELASSFQTVIFKFDAVNDIDLAYFEYQLYDNEFGTGIPINATSSTSKDSSTLISGTSTVNVFLVDVENSTDTETKQYWGRVRSVNTSGNPGTEWTELIGTGDLDLLDDQFIGSLTAAKITSGTIDAAQITLAGNISSIKSSLYNPNDPIATRQGWIIKGDGTAEFSSASIRGNISASSLYFNANNRWGRNSANTADSNEFKVGTTSSYLFYDVANNKVTFTGELSAATGTFSGSLSAASGTFSSYITAGVTQIGKNVRDAADHNGIALDSGSWNNAWVRRGDGSVYFRAGTATKYILMDTQVGATSAIAFPNFSVDNNGSITATSANISGTINASSGTFSGTINATGTISGGTISGATFTGASTILIGNSTSAGYLSIASNSRMVVNGVKFQNRDYSGWDGAFYPYYDDEYDLGIGESSSGAGDAYMWQDIRYRGTLTDFSDRRMKLDIQNHSLGLNFINELKPVSFRKAVRRKIAQLDSDGNPIRNENGSILYDELEGVRTHYGLIAQDVQDALNKLNIDQNTFAPWRLEHVDDPESMQSLGYLEFISPIIKSIQELSNKLDELEARMV